MTDFLDPFERMIAALFNAAAVRAAERGEPDDRAWSELAASGFLDALVPADAGGAGVSFADIVPLWLVLGRHAVPCPVGETMIARALLAQAGRAAPDGPIAVAARAPGAAGRAEDARRRGSSRARRRGPGPGRSRPSEEAVAGAARAAS